MTNDSVAPEALRPGDPAHLGPYELIGRLGQGGMGTVYLAHGPHGGQVAVKMIRADLAPDDEFRRRFRSEVDRVRQVPPFCTAEVLDADPDHEPPYLVVEYVDGPSLAEVVQQRGPLTSANLHGVAIGVATALTAIHGAGVIHRDLKPRNVLLAPGSPKVIDFGIARAMEGSTRHTDTHQLVGTVAYMAPERFGPEAGALTTAADIFAWGAVVAYAGTGRTPFGADSAPATAGRILTQPPDLTGLHDPLRSLVAHALEKDPDDRPTARELLDLLLSTGPQRSPATAAALADQPGLQAAARDAQAATDHHTGGHPEVGVDGPPGPLPSASDGSGVADGMTFAVGLPGTALVEQPTVAPRRRGLIPVQPSAAPISPAALPMASAPMAFLQRPEPPSPDGPVARRRRWAPVAAALVLVAGLVGGLLVAMFAATTGAGPGTSAAEPDVTTAGPIAGEAPDDDLLLTDALVSSRYWIPSADRAEKADCSFRGALVVRRQTTGSFRCKGPMDEQSPDQRVDVGVRLMRKGSCASIWFRFTGNHGYQVRVCETTVLVGTHKSSVPQVYRTFPLDRPVAIGAPSTRVSVHARGTSVEVTRDGARVGVVTLNDPEITDGRVMLGIFTDPPGRGFPPPYEVAFDNVSVWSFGR